jgi:hypothetical protein
MNRRTLQLLLLLVTGIQAFGQSSIVSRLDGLIIDPSGKAVEGAAVKVVDSDRGIAVETASGGDGFYRLPRLSPGRYEVAVSKAGFQRASQTGILLNVNQSRRIDFALTLDQSNSTITVSAAAVAIQGQSVEVSNLISDRKIESLPLNGRNFQRLILLAPGVGAGDQFGDAPINPSFSGTRPSTNSFTVDGVGSNDERLATGFSGVNAATTDLGPDVPNVISTEALQEYRTISSNADATFGRGSGAQVNMVTRSGTNQLHGSGYWHVRNDALDARNFFNRGPFFDSGGRAIVPPFVQNVFGGTVGGPIVKNKHFFFANYEGFRQRRNEQSIANSAVPNAALISQMPGDLGAFYRALYVEPGIVPSTGNPAGAFSALSAADRSAALAAGFPAALFDGNSANGEAGTVLIGAAPKRDVDQDAFLIRSDHRISDRLSLSGRYNQAKSQLTSGSADRAIGNQLADRLNFSAVLQAVWTISPRQILELRGGVMRNRFEQLPAFLPAGVAALNVIGESGLRITGIGTPLTTSVVSRFTDNQTTPQGSINHTWTSNRWTFRSGFDWRSFQLNVANFSAGTPGYNFQGFIGPNGLLGASPGQAQAVAQSATLTAFGQNGGPQSPMRGYRSKVQEYFVQADWRIAGNLTLNLGLRYGYFSPYTEVNFAVSNLYALSGPADPAFDGGRTANQVQRIAADRPLYQKDMNNFQPRLGAAWDIGGRGLQVVRGGYGLYADRVLQIQFTGVVSNQPMALSSTAPNVPFRFAPPPIGNLAASPAVTAVDPNLRNPLVHRINAAYERRIGQTMTASAAYVGSFGRGLINLLEENGGGGVPNNLRPDPRFTTQNQLVNFAHSSYHSLQTSFLKRFSSGLDLTAFYTFSSFRDDWSADAFSTVAGLINTGASAENGFQGGGAAWAPRPRGSDRGNSDYDTPHNFTLSHIYELPFGRGRRFLSQASGITQAIAGGWSASGLFIWRSGQRMNLTLGRDVDDDGNAARDRPALLGGSLNDIYANGRHGRAQYLIPQALAAQVLGVPANVTNPSAALERNPLRAPQVQTYDFSLAKRMALTERVAATLEMNAFNLFNRANFAGPSGSVASALFGVATRTITPSRQLQLGLKLTF